VGGNLVQSFPAIQVLATGDVPNFGCLEVFHIRKLVRRQLILFGDSGGREAAVTLARWCVNVNSVRRSAFGVQSVGVWRRWVSEPRLHKRRTRFKPVFTIRRETAAKIQAAHIRLYCALTADH
jgi:hypothetical protein